MTRSNRSNLLPRTNNRRTPILPMQKTQPNPVVRKTVVVNAEPEDAFAIFTKNMGRWWPKEHHIGGSPMVAVVVEPRNGGRWYEKDEDGSECDWGTVLVYEPPHRACPTKPFSWSAFANSFGRSRKPCPTRSDSDRRIHARDNVARLLHYTPGRSCQVPRTLPTNRDGSLPVHVAR